MITGTIDGVVGFTVAELAAIWNDMRERPGDFSQLEKRLACMAAGLANQLERR